MLFNINLKFCNIGTVHVVKCVRNNPRNLEKHLDLSMSDHKGAIRNLWKRTHGDWKIWINTIKHALNDRPQRCVLRDFTRSWRYESLGCVPVLWRLSQGPQDPRDSCRSLWGKIMYITILWLVCHTDMCMHGLQSATNVDVTISAGIWVTLTHTNSYTTS